MLRDNRDHDPAQMSPKGAYGLIYTLNHYSQSVQRHKD